jgi:Fuc2NAc and GlcNAc transferase
MSPLLPGAVVLGTLPLAAGLTVRFRRVALARGILDVPVARSSHAAATPRGGGVSIVVAMVAALALLAAGGVVPRIQVVGLLGGGLLVAVVGFLDDMAHVPVVWRLVTHFVAAAWVLVWLGGLPLLPQLPFLRAWPWTALVLGALYIVWVLNLVNFMDGIDGLAGTEAVTVCLGGSLLYVLRAPWSPELVVVLVVAAAAAGFLPWNWPPARVFMGDVGSGFLGLVLAALSVQAGRVAPALFWGWAILLGTFVVDATLTLLRRMVRGDRWFEAHRIHAYQHAASRWGHQPVTLAVAAINLFWLLPLAVLVARGSLDGLLGALIAYAPLVALAVTLRAGVPAPAGH